METSQDPQTGKCNVGMQTPKRPYFDERPPDGEPIEGLPKCEGCAKPTSEPRVYVGTKIIEAQPMTDREFSEKVRPIVGLQGIVRSGYCVRYPNMENGVYESWSPKDVFEMAYRRVTAGEKRFLNS